LSVNRAVAEARALRDLQPEEELDRVYLVEHGRTDYNGSGKMHGNHDLSLNDAGRADAERAAKWFKEESGGTVKKIVSSDLKRARETAQIIGEAIGISVSTDPHLRPWRIGEFSGQSPDFVDSRGNNFQFYLDNPDEVIPLGESQNCYVDRWIRTYADYLRSADDTPGTIVLVVHSMNITSAINWHETGKPTGPNAVVTKKDQTSGRVLCVESKTAEEGNDGDHDWDDFNVIVELEGA
jgi:broad specificity phosphatase PhoE